MNPQDIKDWLEALNKSVQTLVRQMAGLLASSELNTKRRDAEITVLFGRVEEHGQRLRKLELRQAAYMAVAVAAGVIIGGLINFALGYLLRTVTG